MAPLPAPTLTLSLPRLLTLSLLLRLILLLYGIAQDALSPLPYTDIDYLVFTDAARFVSRHRSPYLRETYRYTPLLAWLLVPTSWSPQWVWFHFGKVVFAVGDVVAGWLVVRVLVAPGGEGEGGERRGDRMKGGGEEVVKAEGEGQGGSTEVGGRMEETRALKFASVWLLNPVVATISTRGSSEGLLGVMSAGLVWAVLRRKIVLAGLICGLGVHFKIYPFIYGITILLYLETALPPPNPTKQRASPTTLIEQATAYANRERITFTLTALTSFMALNALMYTIYGPPFLTHTFLHHLTRIDHRHNFSPYNTLLHISSMSPESVSAIQFHKLAFVPQLLLSAVLIPLALAKKDLRGAMMCQTWAFVTFNKVVTSQYFIWYIIFLPFYLPYSSFLERSRMGLTAAALWVGTQALWLHRAYALEFLGQSTFFPGLFFAGLAFFAVNCWILGVMIMDVGKQGAGSRTETMVRKSL